MFHFRELSPQTLVQVLGRRRPLVLRTRRSAAGVTSVRTVPFPT